MAGLFNPEYPDPNTVPEAARPRMFALQLARQMQQRAQAQEQALQAARGNSRDPQGVVDAMQANDIRQPEGTPMAGQVASVAPGWRNPNAPLQDVVGARHLNRNNIPPYLLNFNSGDPNSMPQGQ